MKKQIDLLNSKINVRKKQSEQNAKIRAFEKGVEEIMEEFIQAKDLANKEIRDKYREELEDLNKMPQDELISQVINETNKQINLEIENKLQNIEDIKKKKIQNLKSIIKLDS